MTTPLKQTVLVLTVLFVVCASVCGDDKTESKELVVELVGRLERGSQPDTLGLTISGNYAYLCAADEGLHIVDISSPSDPKRLSSCKTPGTALAVAVAGSYAYVADGDEGLCVIDISNPRESQVIGRCGTPGVAHAVAVSGQHAYIGDAAKVRMDVGGLRVIDVSQPTAPQLVASLDDPDTVKAVVVMGEYAYLADKASILWVADISDPLQVKLVGRCNIAENFYGETPKGP